MYKKLKRKIVLRALLPGIAVAAIAVLITWSLYHREEKKTDALRRIRQRGYLVALTEKNTLNYFIYKGEPMGYQFEMLESFARYLGVPLRIIASNDMDTLASFLDNNSADLIAIDLPITSDGKNQARFSTPFFETRLVLVQRNSPALKKGEAPVTRSLKKFPADTVCVSKNKFLISLCHKFYKTTGERAILKELPDISQEELLRRVSAGEIRYALCFENRAMACRRIYPNLDMSLVAVPLFSCGWAMDRSSDSLQTELDKWLSGFKKTGQLKKTFLDYADNQRTSELFKNEYFSVCGNKLSPFDETIRIQSKQIMWDWRLLASLIYQESNFHAGLISSKRASGLMQLMPETAARFGIDSTATLARQIAGGVKYLQYIDKQLPEEINIPEERICFVLACYNVGIGRVLAAREKAEKFGRDKNRWNGHVDYYLLHRSKKDPIAKPDTVDSFPVDYKTEGFVDDIQTRYLHYRNLIK